MADVLYIKWNENHRFQELIKKAGIDNIVQKNDLVAVKTHMGELGGTGFIKPSWIKIVVDEIRRLSARPFITDTNTIYAGDRSNAVGHLFVANEHGFTFDNINAPVIIADGPKGLFAKEVEIQGKHFKKVKIATGIFESDCMVVVSHFKGHLACGFGGAIKNLGMGCATRLGKFEMHSGLTPIWNKDRCVLCKKCVEKCAHNAMTLCHPETKAKGPSVGKNQILRSAQNDNENKIIQIDKSKCVGCGECVGVCRYDALNIVWGKQTDVLQEKVAEYACGAVQNKKCLYINFLNHITSNCDCMGLDEKPLCEDIGILASIDPVAIDMTSIDLMIKHSNDAFKKERPSIDYLAQIRHAENLGLGSTKYNLIKL